MSNTNDIPLSQHAAELREVCRLQREIIEQGNVITVDPHSGLAVVIREWHTLPEEARDAIISIINTWPRSEAQCPQET
ncbi:MAG: hypothetical protein L0Y72_21405 [Gemmataceae bacterium]|nr:hypothetical protein [Gemmataceae bacterium]MCI0741601.1 hypothetical protein [Gemmataceae bacterium]